MIKYLLCLSTDLYMYQSEDLFINRLRYHRKYEIVTDNYIKTPNKIIIVKQIMRKY